MAYKQRIAIEQSVIKLIRGKIFLFLLCQMYGISITQILLHSSTDEEVWNYVVTLSQIITKFRYFTELVPVTLPILIILVTLHKEVQVPLDNVSGISKLLSHRFASNRIPSLIILRIANVIYWFIIFVSG